MDKIINLFKKFNFTESETKVYVTLLQNGAKSGYEVSKISGVPRSKVYNSLELLIKKGTVNIAQGEKSVLYKAEDVQCVINHLKKQNEEMLSELESELILIDKKLENEQIWQVKGYAKLLEKCSWLIKKSQEQVLIQIWKDDLTDELEEIIQQKEEEVGKVLVVLYDTEGQYNTKIPFFYRHGFEKNKIDDMGGRWITVTIDSNEMFYGVIKNDTQAEGIHTKNSSMVLFANEYIKHDVYSIKLIERMSDEEKQSFGTNMLGVRSLFDFQKE